MRAREASALETIRLVLPNVEPSPSAGQQGKALGKFKTNDSGSPKLARSV